MRPTQGALLLQGLAAQGLSKSSPQQGARLDPTSVTQPCMFMHGAK